VILGTNSKLILFRCLFPFSKKANVYLLVQPALRPTSQHSWYRAGKLNLYFSDTNQNLINIYSEEAQIRTPAHIKLRAEALIVYIGYAIQDKSFALAHDGTDAFKVLLKDLITILVDLSSGHSKDDSADIVDAASNALKNVLNIIHATDFLEISASMLESDNNKVHFRF
jgi:hypothetical protein